MWFLSSREPLLRNTLLHGGDKTIASAMKRLYEALVPPTIANGPACRRQPTGDSGLADKPAGPELCEDLFLGYKPVAVLDEIGEDIEHLRLELDELACIAQLVASDVQLIFLEGIDHRPAVRLASPGQICHAPQCPRSPPEGGALLLVHIASSPSYRKYGTEVQARGTQLTRTSQGNLKKISGKSSVYLQGFRHPRNYIQDRLPRGGG
jgi:hypothetical protein